MRDLGVHLSPLTAHRSPPHLSPLISPGRFPHGISAKTFSALEQCETVLAHSGLQIMPKGPSSRSAKAPEDRNLLHPGSTAFSNREWARTWKTAASELESIRRAEIKSAETSTAIVALDDAFRSMLASRSTRPSSGFVEMQTFFRRLRKDAATD